MNNATLTEEKFTHLKQLEADSIHIMREVVAETEHPVMLYSIGKDSSVLLHKSVLSCKDSISYYAH